MVFDKSGTSGIKKPRIAVEGKLIGMQGDSSKAKIFDTNIGKYSWLNLSLVIGQNSDGSTIYKNITAYDIKMEEMPEFKKADELLKNKKKPVVSLECYETEAPALDKVTKQPLMEEVVENRNGKEVFVQKPKMYKNYRMTEDDVKKSFKVLKEDSFGYIEGQVVQEEENITEENIV